MKTGLTLPQLAAQVNAQRNARRDYRLPQNRLRMTGDAKLLVAPDASTLPAITPNDLMHDQIADKLQIPGRYYNRLRTEAPALLASNVNEWLARGTERRFVRTFQPVGEGLTGRAFLGGSYRPLDNFDLVTAIVPPMLDSGLQVVSSEITDRRLYLQTATERIAGEVKKGDVVNLGLVVQNSEVGCGSLTIQVLVYRLACLNGLITASDLPGFRKVHIGWSNTENPDALTDETRRLKDAATWAEARDLIKHAVTQTTMDRVLARLRNIATLELPNPEAAVEIVAEKFGLVEDERAAVIKNLIAGGDVSQWGLVNAVTALAHTAKDYDRCVEIEGFGGKIAEMPGSDFGNDRDI